MLYRAGKVAGHYGGATRRTDSAGYGEAVKVRAFFGKPVDVWRFHIRVAMTRQIAPAPVVGEDEYDVRFLARLYRLNGRDGRQRENNSSANDVQNFIER